MIFLKQKHSTYIKHHVSIVSLGLYENCQQKPNHKTNNLTNSFLKPHTKTLQLIILENGPRLG